MARKKKTKELPPTPAARELRRDGNTKVGIAWTADIRYAVEKVCDRHGVKYTPLGLGAGQAFMEDLLDALVQVPVGVVREAALEALEGGPPVPDRERLQEVVKQALQDNDTVVWDGQTRAGTSSLDVNKQVLRLFEAGSPASPCPNCGGEGAVRDRDALASNPHTALVGCGDECGIPDMLWGIWEGLPRSNTVSAASLQEALQHVLDREWSWELFETDLDSLMDTIVGNVVNALEAQH